MVDKYPLFALFTAPLDEAAEIFAPLKVIYYPLNVFCEKTGAPFEDVHIFTCMFAFVFLSYAFSCVQGSSFARISFSSFCGVSLGFYYYGVSYWYYLLLLSLLSLIYTVPMPCRHMQSYLATLTVVAFLLGRAIYEQMYNAQGLTIKNLLGMMTINAHMYAMNYMDATVIVKEKQIEQGMKVKEPKKKLSTRERKMAECLVDGFNAFEFFGYMTFVSSCFFGMGSEFADYHNLIHYTGKYEKMPRDGSHFFPMLKRLLQALACFAVVNILDAALDENEIGTEAFF